MKLIPTLLIFLLSILHGNAQGNRILSGGELINYGIVDITVVNGLKWSTERSATPGYFSAVDTADYTGCSDEIHIDGYVKKYGNRSFIFPIGSDNQLRTLEISAPLLSTDAYATAWIPGNPSAELDLTSPFAGHHPVTSHSTSISSVSTVGQWDWLVGDGANLGDGTTGTGEGLIIRVSIPDMTSFADAASLRLVGWDGTKWIDLSGGPTANGNTENSILEGKMTSHISAIGIGKTYSTLPLTLESFTAEEVNCKVILKWKTTGEYNTDKFIVEQSIGTSGFQGISGIPATGSLNGSNYSITVTQPAGLSSYRLKMTDKDGRFTYSSIVQIRNTCESSDHMQIFPNPVTSGNQDINVRFKTSYRGKAQVMIFNSLSQQVAVKTIEVTAGENLVTANVLNLLNGSYIIRVAGADGTLIGNAQKFIKQ
ncbi:MAG: T9SS type A sorting domain-containing protein [Chitinophagaceae bacterium]|nr:T9SS type A sorting domain-containing protein [Chitinophagaceae bacterium]